MSRRMLLLGAPRRWSGILMSGDLLACGDKFLMAEPRDALPASEELQGGLGADLRGAVCRRSADVEDRVRR